MNPGVIAAIDPGVIAVFIPIVALFIPIVAIMAKHHHNLVEMRLKMHQQGDHSVMSEMLQLKAQIADLRDTSTRFDMSFDTALQRIEARTGKLEERLTNVEADVNRVRVNQV